MNTIADLSLSDRVNASTDYRKMVALCKLAWMASHAHSVDAGLEGHPPTPFLEGFGRSSEERQTLFKQLLKDATGAEITEIALDNRWKEQSGNHFDLTMKDKDGRDEFAVRVSKPNGLDSGDLMTVLAMASEYKYTDPSCPIPEMQTPEEYLNDHRMFLHILSKSGLDSLNKIYPGKDAHIRNVTASMKLASKKLAQTIPEIGDSWLMTHENIELVTNTARCHDLGSSMLVWMTLEGNDPYMEKIKAYARDPNDGPGWDEARVIDACLNIGLGLKDKNADTKLLAEKIQAGLLAANEQGASTGINNWQNYYEYLRDWHVQLIEITTRSPLMAGLRPAALHHLDFTPYITPDKPGQTWEQKVSGHLSSPGYVINNSDYTFSLADAMLPIMDKLDAGFNTKKRNAHGRDNSQLFAEALEDLVHAQITNGEVRPNASVHTGLLRYLFDQGVMDDIARGIYQTFIPEDRRADIKTAFSTTMEKRGISELTRDDIRDMIEKDRTIRWTNRVQQSYGTGRGASQAAG